LIVGPHEGMSSEWLLSHVLTSPAARLVCVERFDRYGACAHFRDRGIPTSATALRAAFARNVLDNVEYAGKVSLVEGAASSTRGSGSGSGSGNGRGNGNGNGGNDLWADVARVALSLGSGTQRDRSFDVVVVDHTRNAADTLELAILALRALRPGGVLVLTNYTHAREHDVRCPRPGIDAFLDTFAHELRVLQTAWHTFVQKRVDKLPLPPCMSEQFDPHSPIPTCASGSRSRKYS
jgi:SAM-dependent methyltransferase